ncbi:hypothetical protein [Segetibacter sp.]|jgi:hypothetical protein|uniref:hypothetical protein n=1 Tax=Segetibacter sp. TaxID=2231182 RepID=UPI002636DF5F|nr:hypothetical protein [Segetibacter sp.]MCW3079910.1 hypothetical protein [Segetibacter sp.]
MVAAETFAKAFELSKMTRALFLQVEKGFPYKDEIEIKSMYLERIKKCTAEIIREGSY